MIELKAERLFIFPIKGAAAVERDELTLDPEGGVAGDRMMGLAIDPTPAEGDGAFRRKIHFIHGARWPMAARLRPEVAADDAGALSVTGFRLRGDDGDSAVALEDAASAIAPLAAGAPPARLVRADPGGRFADRPSPFVSIINLDTLEAFAAFVGDPALAAPARWRCNAFVRAGFGAEYVWAREQADLALGGAPVKVELLLGRCAMVTAEPELGRVDHPDLLDRLRVFEAEHGFEHPEERAPVMGVLALPLTAAVARRS